MSVDVRLIEPGEVDRWVRSVSIPFLNVATPEAYDHWRPAIELDRTWAAVDGDRFVGNSCVFTRDVTLPGGLGELAPVIPLAAVTAVGVHPTHRRRGILRRLMGAMLADARRRGEPLAGLQASEAGIYGRFGFGCASSVTEVTIRSQGSTFAQPAPQLDLRLCDADEASKVLPALFDRLRRTRPGQVSRDDAFWSDFWIDRPKLRQGATARFYVVGDDGFATWRIADGWPASGPPRMLVDDLAGATPEVEAALWRFLLDVDLVHEVVAEPRPVDEPLRWRLADPRRLRVTGSRDFLWLSVLDVPAAFTARGYRRADRLVFEVLPAVSAVDGDGGDGIDPAAGRWVLDAGPEGSTCRPARSGESVDLQLGAADLGPILLGGVEPSLLAAAGRVAESRPGALDRADALFAAHPQPFSQTGF
jgi:predicted acetyltransferase